MRARPALIALLLLCGCSVQPPVAPRPQAKPMRVMSLNQCTDQILLALLPPDRIASVTWLARDRDASVMYREAAKVGVNHGMAEEVVRQRPDLVIAGAFSTPATRALLRRLDYPMIAVDDPDSIADIRTATRRIASAVGEEARAERLLAHMDRTLAQLAEQSRKDGPPVRVAAWDSAGFSVTSGSLFNTILAAAGAETISDARPGSGTGKPDAEMLLQAAPTLLVKGSGIARKPGLRDNFDGHPLIRRYWDGARTLVVPQAYYVCGTPFVGDAGLALRRQLRAAVRNVRAPLPFARSAGS